MAQLTPTPRKMKLINGWQVKMKTADFDLWRDNYDKLTYKQQLKFYNQVAIDHPLQRGFDEAEFEDFLRPLGEITVIEMGGWKGELAKYMLERLPKIRRWLNYEISEQAIIENICPYSTRFEALIPSDFLWNIELPKADVFVSSHTIEHIRVAELDKLFSKLPVKYIALQAPLGDEGTDWAGYYGSHILEVGWNTVIELLRGYGFNLTHSKGEFRGFAR